MSPRLIIIEIYKTANKLPLGVKSIYLYCISHRINSFFPYFPSSATLSGPSLTDLMISAWVRARE